MKESVRHQCVDGMQRAGGSGLAVRCREGTGDAVRALGVVELIAPQAYRGPDSVPVTDIVDSRLSLTCPVNREGVEPVLTRTR